MSKSDLNKTLAFLEAIDLRRFARMTEAEDKATGDNGLQYQASMAIEGMETEPETLLVAAFVAKHRLTMEAAAEIAEMEFLHRHGLEGEGSQLKSHR